MKSRRQQTAAKEIVGSGRACEGPPGTFFITNDTTQIGVHHIFTGRFSWLSGAMQNRVKLI